jgi:ribosomal protein S6--L-glutamate ligase
VTLKAADIPMPPTTITENLDAALKTVANYGEAAFKPLFSTKAKGMVVIRDETGAQSRIEKFATVRLHSLPINETLSKPSKSIPSLF